jgi:cytochrome c oxidase assembly protein Cox11
LVKPYETKAIIKPQSDTKKVVAGKTATIECTVNNKTSNKPVVAAVVVSAAPRPMIPAFHIVTDFEKRRAEIMDTMRDFKVEIDPNELPNTVTAKSAPNDAPVVRNPGQAMVIIFY